MKNNIFIKSALILLFGSLSCKLLGFLIRIIFTNIVGNDGINLYSAIMPTMSLFIAIAQFGLPLSISTIISRGVKRGKNVFISIIPIIVILNIVLILTCIFSSNYIACNLLKVKEASKPIYMISFILPFICLNSVFKGYYFGRQRMHPYALSNIVEQIIRIFLILFILPIFKFKGITDLISTYILFSVISEISSLVIFLIFLPKNIKINKDDLYIDYSIDRDILKISMPSLGSRLVGNIAYFLEPIILFNTLNNIGYTKNFILSEYGAYNAYSLTFLMIPSFIVSSISTALVPEVSKLYEKRNYKELKRKLYNSLVISLLLGLVFNTLVFIFRDYLLDIVYNTNMGSDYIKYLAFVFILYNLEGPLYSTMQALDKAKIAFIITTSGVIIKTLIMYILSLFKIGLYGLIISEAVNILYVVILSLIVVYRILKRLK